MRQDNPIEDPKEGNEPMEAPLPEGAMDLDDLGDTSQPSRLRAFVRGFRAPPTLNPFRHVARWGLLGVLVILMVGCLSLAYSVGFDPGLSPFLVYLFLANGAGVYLFLVPASGVLVMLIRVFVCFEGAVFAISGPMLGAIGNELGSMGNCKSCGISPILLSTVPVGALIALLGLFAAPPPLHRRSVAELHSALQGMIRKWISLIPREGDDR